MVPIVKKLPTNYVDFYQNVLSDLDDAQAELSAASEDVQIATVAQQQASERCQSLGRLRAELESYADVRQYVKAQHAISPISPVPEV